MGTSDLNPWRRVSRRVAYENPWIEILHDDVIRPDGQPGIYGVVHFRNRAIGVVPLDAEGRVLLVGQFRYTMDHYSWEIRSTKIRKRRPAASWSRKRVIPADSGESCAARNCPTRSPTK